MMTRKAHALGMSRTLYRNASGLPNDQQITTARDLTILARAIEERFPRYFKYFSTHEFDYDGEVIGNHDHLLGRVDGVDGIKTGYTRASGFNLLTSVHRDGRSLVAVVMGGRTSAARDATMEQLIADHIAEASNKGRTATMIADASRPPRRCTGRRDAGRGPRSAAPASRPTMFPRRPRAPRPRRDRGGRRRRDADDEDGAPRAAASFPPAKIARAWPRRRAARARASRTPRRGDAAATRMGQGPRSRSGRTAGRPLKLRLPGQAGQRRPVDAKPVAGAPAARPKERKR